MHTSFKHLHDAGACKERYRFLAKSLGGIRYYGKKTPLPYSKILESNGFADCLWALTHGDDDAVLTCRLTPIASAALRRERISRLRRWVTAPDWWAVFLCATLQVLWACVFLLIVWVVVSIMEPRVKATLEGLRCLPTCQFHNLECSSAAANSGGGATSTKK